FFGNNVQSSTPSSTLASGLAVCEGYAGLFSALALKAGLQCEVIGGASKGFGHSQLGPNAPLPGFKSTHAWNACKIDGGVWKLIDPCWGAGNVEEAGPKYNKHFSPNRFTQSNMEFGTDHFPSEDSKQFREDGRVLGWEEYVRGQPNGTGAGLCSNTVPEEGLSASSFLPRANPIIPSSTPGPTIRFLFQNICPHWDPVRNGPGVPYLYHLCCSATKDDKHKSHRPMNHQDGVWWLDVLVRDLGGAGETVRIHALSEFKGKGARGLSAEEWNGRHGKGWSANWKSVANWTVG
ncbi:hypothetical protein LTR95_012309, partial [Oleoguttula sp. CCFEE 5521]